MAILNWGHCTVMYAKSVNGAPSGSWTEIDTPKEDTTELSAEQGTEKTANEEGGALVDYMPAKNTYTLAFDLFVKKGVDAPFDDEDGVVAGEWAFRVESDDKDCAAIQIDRSILRVDESYSTDEGSLLHHEIRCLKPAEGKTIKRYVPSEE